MSLSVQNDVDSIIGMANFSCDTLVDGHTCLSWMWCIQSRCSCM